MPIYMKYDGIDGAVTATGHEKWIEVFSAQWGTGRSISTATGSGMNREASAVSVSEVTVSKNFDVSSLKLLQEHLTPGTAKKVQLDFVQSGQDKLVPYLTTNLENVMISGYSLSSGGDAPSESISLNFTKVLFTETGSDQTGADGQPNKVGYDVALAKSM